MVLQVSSSEGRRQQGTHYQKEGGNKAHIIRRKAATRHTLSEGRRQQGTHNQKEGGNKAHIIRRKAAARHTLSEGRRQQVRSRQLYDRLKLFDHSLDLSPRR
ncbi:uncharacterized protein LOC131947219 [Physella acuta]|uniref:uncharacterized protein LOC131947219 n=1 Tax=Physella acuta TaxID=109671 RepID=UPI0027DC9A0E|nr:uncharacterized protein LOC131947219 [Physella acuta]